MKKQLLLFFVLPLSIFMSCTKTYNSANNYTNAATPPAQPTFTVNGIQDMVFTNWFAISAALNISVQYFDSTQEAVTLSLSALPAGIAMDTTWATSGTPAYSTTLSLYDTTLQGAAPGTYPMTLTATTASGKQKTYPFNIKIQPMLTNFLGKYSSCYLYCDTTLLYTDSIYRDPVILNKIWFSNYANSGYAIYGLISLPVNLNIPDQTFGGHTYNGQGAIGTAHAIDISITSSCAINMR